MENARYIVVEKSKRIVYHGMDRERALKAGESVFSDVYAIYELGGREGQLRVEQFTPGNPGNPLREFHTSKRVLELIVKGLPKK